MVDQQEVVDSPVQVNMVDQQPVVDAPESSLRRSIRERIPSSRYSPSKYVLLIDREEPESLDEAIERKEKENFEK
ncbi:hypothetical protein P3S68_005610 [Capsicum galapagoense]